MVLSRPPGPAVIRSPVRSGVTLPLSGRHAVQGEQARRGFELWREAVQGDGGLVVDGVLRPLELHILDDGSSPRRALSNVRALLSERTRILFGPYGRASALAVGSYTGGAGQVLWNHGSSADDVYRPFVVSMPTPASRYLVGVVDLALARGCRTVMIAANAAPFGRTVANGGAARAVSVGMAVRVLLIPPGTWPAHHVELLAAADGDTAVILCGRLDDDIAAVAALRAMGGNLRVLAAVGAGVGRFGEVLGADAQGVVGPSQWELEDGTVDMGPSPYEVVQRYRQRHSGDPDYLAVQAWASGLLAAAAVAEVGTDPPAMWRWALRFRGRTPYGEFALTQDGRQIGHELRLIEWGSEGHRTVIG
jgi:branched-chain amino acid transport system substrate-binding protein